MSDQSDHSTDRGLWAPALAFALLAACSAGGDGSGGEIDPGPGGGAGGSGGAGNPLDIVLDFKVTNSRSTPRTETIRASVPFPKTGYQSLSNLVVSGHQTAWLPLQYWPDNSIKLAQAQFTDTLGAHQTKTYEVARDEPAMNGPFTRNSWVNQAGGSLQVGAEVSDTFYVNYRGFAAGEGEILQESPLVQVKRWRTYHMPVGASGIGRDYLSSTFYATEFRDMPFVLVDWIVGNDYQGADTIPTGNTDPNLRPLGPVDVRRLRFLCKGMSGVQPYRPTEEAIASPTVLGDGFTSFQVMQNTFIGDAQTRRYRFLLRFEPNNADPLVVANWRGVATAMLAAPLFPLASHSAWEQTEAAGLLGGPIAGPSDAQERAEAEYQSWRGANHFGTWGSRGDPKQTATTGTPRNHPLTQELAHAIQGQNHGLLLKLEQMAWIQAARPYHFWDMTVGAEQRLLIWGGMPHWASEEQLGRAVFQNNDPYAAYRTLLQGETRPHGWEGHDIEHFTADTVFDYWCISGDEWAKEELRQLGEGCKASMRLRHYATAHPMAARAEGWCMQAFAQVYQARRDPAMKSYALRRVHEVIQPERHTEHPSRALEFHPNYLTTHFPLNHEYFLPWHHGGLLYGYLGAYRCFEDPLLLTIADDVVEMVDYSWVTNYNDPQLGFVTQGLRYYVPVSHNTVPVTAQVWDNTPGIGVRFGSSALGGAHSFLIGGLLHLAEMTDSPSVRTRALNYGGQLLGTLSENGRWNPWEFCIPSSYAQ